MDRHALDAMWDAFRQKYGIYLRLLEAIPDDCYQREPISGMRTPAEIVVHVSAGVVREIARGVAEGGIAGAEEEGDGTATGLLTADAAAAFARGCWKEADAAVDGIGDEELQATVATPWDMSFPGHVAFQILSDEFLHHRGQLYAFVRACGSEPPFLWSFEENPSGFRPEG